MIDYIEILTKQIYDLVWTGMNLMQLVKNKKEGSEEFAHVRDKIQEEVEKIVAKLMARAIVNSATEDNNV